MASVVSGLGTAFNGKVDAYRTKVKLSCNMNPISEADKCIRTDARPAGIPICMLIKRSPNRKVNQTMPIVINHRQRVPASAGRKSPSRQLQIEVRPAAAADSFAGPSE